MPTIDSSKPSLIRSLEALATQFLPISCPLRTTILRLFLSLNRNPTMFIPFSTWLLIPILHFIEQKSGTGPQTHERTTTICKWSPHLLLKFGRSKESTLQIRYKQKERKVYPPTTAKKYRKNNSLRREIHKHSRNQMVKLSNGAGRTAGIILTSLPSATS